MRIVIIAIFLLGFIFKSNVFIGIIWNFLLPFSLIFAAYCFYHFFKRHPKGYYKLFALSLLLIILWDFLSPLYTDFRAEEATGETKINVLTYNLFFRNKRPEKSLRIIKSISPDIFAAQEVTPEWDGNLSIELKKHYPYKLTIPQNGTHGLGIYSKYKLKPIHILHNTSNRPIAQICETVIANQKILLINAHLASPGVAVENPENFSFHYKNIYNQRCKEYEAILDFVLLNEVDYDSVIFLGDLNTLKFENLYLEIRKKWLDTYNKCGEFFKYNFPNTGNIIPLITIDYILVRGRIEPIKSEIISGGSSDHLAILSTLIL